MQKLLLLPELSNTAINSDPINVTGQPCSHRLVSELSDKMNNEHDLSHKATSEWIMASGLTASWTHV